MSLLPFLQKMLNPEIGNDLPSQGGFSGMMNQSDNYGLPSPIISPDYVAQNMAPITDDSGQDMSNVNPMGGNPKGNGVNVAGLYNNLYTPQHTAEDAYNAMLAQYPQHEPASLMRKIVASLAGLGSGPKGAEQVLDQPFDEKLTDWKNQMGPLMNAANLERYQNANERQLASQQTSREIQAADEQRKEAKDAEDAKVKEFRARAYDFKQRHPDWKMVKQTDAKGKGTYWFVNPQDANDKINTRLEDGMVSDYDLQVLKNNAAQTRTETQVAGQKAVVAEKNWDIFTDPKSGKTYRISKEPGAKAEQIMLPGDTPDATPVPAGPLDKVGPAKGTGTNKDTPTQQKIAEYLVAQKIAAEHPEWQQWIHLASRGPNTYTIDPPPTIPGPARNFFERMMGSDPQGDVDTYKAMQDEFKKRGVSVGNSNTSATNQAVSTIPDKLANPNPSGAPGPNATVKEALDYKTKRLRAIKTLQDSKIQVTEQNIAAVMATKEFQ